MTRALRRWQRVLAALVVGVPMAVGLAACVATAGAQVDTTAAARVESREQVVVIHGLGRSASAMRPLAQRLADAGYAVTLVGYDSFGATTGEAVAEVQAQIDACCAASSTLVHFVGHSLGGLLIRAYLADRAIPQLGRVVMLGTPNQGTPVVDRNRDAWWMRLAGPLANSLGTGSDGFAKTLPAPSYPVGVIAGQVSRDGGPMGELGEPNDGLVPVASTRLTGMQDFAIVDVRHSAMRDDERVAQHTIAFLRDGRF
ncbi:alpha/beta fold hydrolase [Piscinibacter sakaiensis]|uniref:alpha/beta fold hydrolase n=1 Tax=Piscinibacter sakaiensis TaxID=1547922 RepID=UPI003AAB1DF6